MKVLQKNELKIGRYYSGYVNQNYCSFSPDQPKLVGMWDGKQFIFWEFDGNRKNKRTISYLPDIDNEIEYGFFPAKEIIPKEEYLID